MNDWKSRISGCFGENDLIFAGHPLDEDRAFNLLVALRKENIGWREIEAAFRAFLVNERAGPDHINEQIAKVEERYRPWLLD